MISKELITEIMRLETAQNDYTPNPDIAAQLEEKTLVLVVGPACVGKTTVINRVAELDDRFGIVGSFTTREPRADEGGKSFTYIPQTEDGLASLFLRIERHEVVQYIVHPTLKHFYGTVIGDYSKDYNLLDYVASSIPIIKKLPFKSSPVAALVVEASQWQSWFSQRFPVGNPDRIKRLDEAVMSLRWLLGQSPDTISWIINKPGNADVAASEVIRVGLGESSGHAGGRKQAELCLEAARGMR